MFLGIKFLKNNCHILFIKHFLATDHLIFVQDNKKENYYYSYFKCQISICKTEIFIFTFETTVTFNQMTRTYMFGECNS